MHHPAELKIHQYLSKVRHGDSTLSPEVVEQVVEDVRAERGQIRCRVTSREDDVVGVDVAVGVRREPPDGLIRVHRSTKNLLVGAVIVARPTVG